MRSGAALLFGIIAFIASCDGPHAVTGPAHPAAKVPAPRGGSVWARGAIAAGEGHTCAIRPGGHVVCWGHNEEGQVGDGFSADRPAPQLVPEVEGATAVAAGFQSSCALLTDGGVKCWGGRTLGIGRAIPVRKVEGVAAATSIAMSTWLACALTRSGTVSCWGLDGQATPVVGLEGTQSIAAGFDHLCALTAKGRVRCFSVDDPGGDKAKVGPRIDYIPNVEGAVDLALAGGAGCALAPSGRVKCWRFLGSEAEARPTPTVEIPGVTDAIDLIGGFNELCAARASGGASCWSDGEPAALARDPKAEMTLRDAPYLRRYHAVAIAGIHACGLDAKGAALCWGADDGSLGSYSATGTRALPQTVANLQGAVAVVGGEDWSCALLNGGSVACWGSGPAAGTKTDEMTAAVVGGIPPSNQLSGGLQFACATQAGTNTHCWGNVTWRDCLWRDPDNCQPAHWDAATKVADLLDIPDAIAISDPCAVKRDGKVACYDKQSTKRGPVTELAGISEAINIDGSCVIMRGGKIACWGANDSGQVGDGTRTRRPGPHLVRGLSGVSQLAAGERHVCALTDGSVYCWGDNAHGQLGDGTTDARSLPTKVIDLPPANGISCGAAFTCAVLENGTISCWGSNKRGALGDGTGHDRSKPATVANVAPAISVGAGREHACAVLATREVMCWGASRGAGVTKDVSPDKPRLVTLP